jgi:parvulin-like peptidyl-prolyl isomerase
MKTTMIALAAMLMTTGAVTAADTNSANISKPTSSVSTTKSMQFLLDENQRLLKEVDLLSNEVEELKGTLAYNQMMDKLLDNLVEEANADAQADEAARESYNNLMGNMLLKLGTENQLDRQADAQALAGYQQLMGTLLISLKS